MGRPLQVKVRLMLRDRRSCL